MLQMQIGFEIEFNCPAPTPMLLTLNVHSSRAADLRQPDLLQCEPPLPVSYYHDQFSNYCGRIVAPAGPLVLRTNALIMDSGEPDAYAPWAQQLPVEQLPESTLVYLLGSRYCETDQLCEMAWQRFSQTPPG